ncbi:PH domain-containing protein [Lysobacter koreensis]|uniref:PH domain-containing protein n=1 Tax=Lysobacter koreensis TaxID=266122 RepID=A0ABW2YK29_9GAMM
MTDPFDATRVAVAAPTAADWQRSPPRARSLFVLGHLLLALPGGAAGLFLARFSDLLPSPVGAGLGLLLGVALGAWLGLKRYKHSYWRHDDEGLAVRRGKLWFRETRVPATRVQHLDLKRGPLQRSRRLATLVVHTAGTRHSAVTVPHLDADDAERLRERLSRQIDHDDA